MSLAELKNESAALTPSEQKELAAFLAVLRMKQSGEWDEATDSEVAPERRGMASSLQACIGSTANGLVAGVVAPLVMHSTLALALTSISMLGIGLLAWLWLHRRWPEIGRAVSTH